MVDKLQIHTLLKHLQKYPDSYVIIGGIATSLILEERGFPFRETKDFDIVLLADANNPDFNKDLCALLKEGKYKNAISNGKKACYRFIEPETPGYPRIIELFSHEEHAYLHNYLQKIQITFNEEDLSTIVLNDEVVDFIKERKITIDLGVSVVDALGLIALKSHAYFRNLKLYNEKQIVGRENYAKHKNDVIRLLLSLNGDEGSIRMPDLIKQDCSSFRQVLNDSKSEFKNINKNAKISLENLVSLYAKIFH